jgi:hypothetical protein
MDSIERMRRINDLTRELKQHGFAESSFDAIKQANQIYGSDEMDDHVKHGIISKSAHERIVKDENMEQDNTVDNEHKLTRIVSDMGMLTDKMNEIVRAINDLDGRLSQLTSRLDKHDKLIASNQAATESRVTSRQEQVKSSNSNDNSKIDTNTKPVEGHVNAEHTADKPAQGHVHKDEYDLNQRTGNFQSQDVAIDKMFYFGNKK